MTHSGLLDKLKSKHTHTTTFPITQPFPKHKIIIEHKSNQIQVIKIDKLTKLQSIP